jgi:hypothetical protein
MARSRASGTHRGDLMGISPTERSEVTGLNLTHFKNAQITDEWVEWDRLGMLRQLGVLPKRDSAQERALRAISNLRTRVTGAIGR